MADSKAGTGKVKDEPKQSCCAKKQNIKKNKRKKQNKTWGQVKITGENKNNKQGIVANLKGLPLAKSDLTIKTNSTGLLTSKQNRIPEIHADDRYVHR